MLAGASFLPASASLHLSSRDLDAIAIGDSVMFGAKSQLRKQEWMWWMQVSLVRRHRARSAAQAGTGLPEHVVVHLGTNGNHVKMCRQMVRAAGAAARISGDGQGSADVGERQ